MAVKIRLKRMGSTHAPFYRVVVMDSRTKRDGRAIEEIGKYQPLADPSVVEISSERALYWLSVGAQPTEQVQKLLKMTGDWEKFTGEKSDIAVKPQPEKQDKKALYEAAVAAANNMSDADIKAATTSRRKKKAEEEAPAEETSSEQHADTPAEGAPEPVAEPEAAPAQAEAPAEGAEA